MVRPESVAAVLVEEARRRLTGESLPRLRKCIALLTDADLALPGSATAPAPATIIAHVCGNLRQWVSSGLGGKRDTRNRKKEFALPPPGRDELVLLVEETFEDVDRALRELDPSALLRPIVVQGFSETGVSVLVHAVEHCSYHVGQVTWIVKSRGGVDTGYYAGVDLDATGS